MKSSCTYRHSHRHESTCCVTLKEATHMLHCGVVKGCFLDLRSLYAHKEFSNKPNAYAQHALKTGVEVSYIKLKLQCMYHVQPKPVVKQTSCLSSFLLSFSFFVKSSFAFFLRSFFLLRKPRRYSLKN